jgi:hypothetical protein
MQAGCRSDRLAAEFPIKPTHKAPKHFADAEHGYFNLWAGADGDLLDRKVGVGDFRLRSRSDHVGCSESTRQNDTYARLFGRALIWINTGAVFFALVHPMEVAINPARRSLVLSNGMNGGRRYGSNAGLTEVLISAGYVTGP